MESCKNGKGITNKCAARAKLLFCSLNLLFFCDSRCRRVVESIGKSGLRFENPDFGFEIEREIRKRISRLGYLFLDFLFTVRSVNPRKDLKNCP